VPFENSNAQDVTAEYADLDGRLKELRAEEESYVQMLRAARRVGELMEIKDRLSSVRQQIASMESQRKALANESALSTIRATFEQKVRVEDEEKPKDGGFDETWAKALNGLSAVGEFLGNAAIYLFVFAPIWLPPVLLFWWLGRKARA
jgi:predicted nuclease with TOPRIM domain